MIINQEHVIFRLISYLFNLYFTEHGSLTIVRRSNSRKNFTQIDPQAQTIGSPSSGSISFFQTPISETLAERLGARATSNGSGASGGTAAVGDKRTIDNNSGHVTSSVGKMQPSSPNQTNYITDNIQPPPPIERPTIDYRLSRDTIEYPGSSVIPIEQQLNTEDKMSSQVSTPTANQSITGLWDTVNLPLVDTPDALNKAAVR